MTDHREPRRHADSRVDVTRNYVTACVRTLLRQGLIVDRSWLDPSGPRDATVVLGDSRALVWDEMTGWRGGVFRAGEPGVRTTLDDLAHLGGGPLPTPAELAWRVATGAHAARREHRSYADSDGFDEALRAY
jgi:Family of unknown function (DUF6292)